MTDQNLPFRIRPMRIMDVELVYEIEQRSFSMPWSPLAYIQEVKHNRRAFMGVVEMPPPADSDSDVYVKGELRSFGGMWRRWRRAHISTLASHPDYRGQGFGELMLAALVARAMYLRVHRVSLDVRVSNSAAQSLYQKYGFVYAKRQPGYYTDNQEDAFLMVIPELSDTYHQYFYGLAESLQGKIYFQDLFSGLQLERMSTKIN